MCELKISVEEIHSISSDLTSIKDRLMRVGLYRTAHLIDIPLQEIGRDAQGELAPEYEKKRQQETLTP